MLDLSKMIPPPALRGESVSVSYDADGWQKFRHGCGAPLQWTIRHAGYGEAPVFQAPGNDAFVSKCPACGQRLTWPDTGQQAREEVV